MYNHFETTNHWSPFVFSETRGKKASYIHLNFFVISAATRTISIYVHLTKLKMGRLLMHAKEILEDR